MTEFHYIIQLELSKGIELKIENKHTTFFSSDSDWKSLLIDLNARLVDKQPILFASIEITKYVRKHLSNLASGIIMPVDGFDESILFWNRYSTVLPRSWLLNHDCIILPFGSLKHHVTKIERIYGNRIFIKPLSAWKTFTGFDCIAHNINQETSSLRQAENVLDGELTIVTDYKPISETEYRFWCIDGKVISSSAYSWNGVPESQDIPLDISRLVEDAADFISIYENALVIDACYHSGVPKIIELNAISTSGWYEGVDINKLLSEITKLYV